MNEKSHSKVDSYEPNRKLLRWKNYDYTRSGIYFVTFCTHLRVYYFGDIVKGTMQYSHQGCVAHTILKMAHQLFSKVKILNFVVMPDHIHILLSIFNEEADLRAFEHRNDMDMSRYAKESLSAFIGSFKSAITRECHNLNYNIIWQNGFFDHVVRNHNEQIKIDKYISDNPMRWEIDKRRNDIFM